MAVRCSGQGVEDKHWSASRCLGLLWGWTQPDPTATLGMSPPIPLIDSLSVPDGQELAGEGGHVDVTSLENGGQSTKTKKAFRKPVLWEKVNPMSHAGQPCAERG